MWAVEAFTVPAIVVASLAALVAVGKAVYWLYRWANRLEDSMKYVESEMRHNGGATLRDGMAETRRLVAEEIEATTQDRIATAERLDSIERQLEGITQ